MDDIVSLTLSPVKTSFDDRPAPLTTSFDISVSINKDVV